MSIVYLIASVWTGVLFVFLMKPNKKFIRLLLAFSGAYLLSVTILHLLPDVYHHSGNTRITGMYILLGIVLQSVLESFSKGAEHGHIHHHGVDKKIPVLLFVSLCTHAFSEGLPIEHAGENLLWAIVVHKIPITIVLTGFLIQAKFSRTIIIILLTIFGFMSPLGVFLAEKIPFFEKYTMEITAVIIGVFLHISTIILFESSEDHSFNLQKFMAIFLGILLTIFTL
ncbi:MAG: ZIP family metal transporter [Flavobacteriaceae bacterium]|nr:MAG: ZIP family metal transporter [Flavobacteriaceae bacterium]